MGAVDINLDGLFGGLFNVIDQVVVDKDKAAEIKYKVLELKHDFATTLVTQKTTPKVDATVKLMYAFIPFFRPVGTACMTAFAIYADTNGIELSPTVEYILYGAFPAWGASRHIEKKNTGWLDKLKGKIQ